MDQLQHYRSHPPRCIKGFVATPTELPDVEHEGHASLSELKASMPETEIDAPEHCNPLFALACACGSKLHTVHGYRWTDPSGEVLPTLLSPLSLKCAGCKKSTVVYDSGIHGYNAELGHGPNTMRAEGELVIDTCMDCEGTAMEVMARFEYPDDLLNGDFEDFAGREQDLFTWFSLMGTCSKCRQTMGFTDLECA